MKQEIRRERDDTAISENDDKRFPLRRVSSMDSVADTMQFSCQDLGYT